MKRLKIFTWHIHGSYLYYLAHIPHDIYIPKSRLDKNGYIGITPSYPWPDNLFEIPEEEVSKHDFDCVLYQSHGNYLEDQFETLSDEQRESPKIFLEHDPPREHPTNTVHPVTDPDILVVHVSDFNRLMWDNREAPTTMIDHGVVIPENVSFEGSLERGIVVVNNIQKRGRRLGLDIFNQAKERVPLDYYGMGWDKVGGVGEARHSQLPGIMSKYRFFFNPIRYTSMPLSLCEAMMAGLPIVGLATTEVASVVENGVNGFVSNKPEELIRVCKTLAADKELARKWGQGALETARERFSIKRFVKDWNKTLEMAVGKEPLASLGAESESKEKSWTLQL